MKKLCRKCGKAFRGYGAVCDCVMEQLDLDRNGQTRIFTAQRAESEWDEFCSAIDEVLGVTSDKDIPEEALRTWLHERCKSRKTREDWTGLGSLYRNFQQWSVLEYTPAAFEAAVQQAGYAVHRGMVSRLLLKEDYDYLQVRTPAPRT